MIYFIEYYSNDGGGTTYRMPGFYSTPEKATQALKMLVDEDAMFAAMYLEDDVWITKAEVL